MFPARVNLFISLKTEDAKTGLLGSVFVTSGKLIIILAGFSSLFITIPLQISQSPAHTFKSVSNYIYTLGRFKISCMNNKKLKTE